MGLEENTDTENTIKVYPNPASHKLFIDFGRNEIEKARVILYNINGLKVRDVHLNTRSEKSQELDLSGLSAGLYLLRMSDDHGDVLKTSRIIIR